MARRFAGMAPKIVKGGPIVKASDYTTNPSLSMQYDKKGGGLFGGGKGGKGFDLFNVVGTALPFMNPFGLKAAAILGTGAVANQMFGPKATQQAILERDLVGGEYDVGPLGGAYEAIDTLLGGGTIFDMDEEKLTKTRDKGRRKDIEGSNIYSQAISYGLTGSDPLPGETVEQYTARVARPLRQAVQMDSFNNPVNTELRLARQQAQDRDFSLREQNLGIQRMGVQGNIANTQLQILQAGETEKARMHAYSQDLQQKRENDRYRTTAGLIQGLGALGAAFAL